MSPPKSNSIEADISNVFILIFRREIPAFRDPESLDANLQTSSQQQCFMVQPINWEFTYREENWQQGEEGVCEKPYYGFTEGSQFFAVGLLNISAEIDF